MKIEMVEFRLYSEKVNYSKCPIYMDAYVQSGDVGRELANDIAAIIADEFKTEVRWNYVGLSQGHYIGTVYKLNLN